MKHKRSEPTEPFTDSGYMLSPDQYLAGLETGELPKQPAGPTRPLKPIRPPRRHRWRRWVVGVLVIMLLGVFGYGSVIAFNIAHISKHPGDLSTLHGADAGRVNVLVMGEGDPGHAGRGLTDTMILISLDTKNHRSAQISLPRDMRVKISGYGFSKLNAANAYGGPELAASTVSDTLGVPVDYYVSTNFTGLKDLVDAVGGIDVDVKTALIDSEYPCDYDQYKVCGFNIAPGLQHMNGTTALQYARCRKGTCGDDFGRAARQQEVIRLIRTKATTWSTILNPAKLTAITSALRANVTTTMSPFAMAQFGYDLNRAQNNNPVQLVISTSNYLISSGTSSDLVPRGNNWSAIDERVQNIFTDSVQETDVPTP